MLADDRAETLVSRFFFPWLGLDKLGNSDPDKKYFADYDVSLRDSLTKETELFLLSQLRDSGANPNLELLGVLMTMFDGRTKLSHQVVHEVRQHFGPVVFETVIPRTTRLAEAPSFGKPIIHYDKYSAGAAAYEVLTQELLKRLNIVGAPAPQPNAQQA